MIGLSSSSAGILFLPKPVTGEYAFLDVVEGTEREPVVAQYLYSAAQDWKEIEGPDANDLLKTAISEYWLSRIVSLLRLAIGGLEKTLEKRVLEDVEELLGSRVSSEKALDHLLVAPLIDPGSSIALAKSALSYNFSAVASVLDELAGLQSLLCRLNDNWLGLSETMFSEFSESREMIWMTLVEKHGMKRLLRAASRHDFATQWNLLAFHFPTSLARSGLGRIGRELSLLLFPGTKHKGPIDAALTQETKPATYVNLKQTTNVLQAFERTKKQIAAIALAVSQGHNIKAERFLRELIQEQTSFAGGKSYAVKSLCNIAQRCADMFRTDFEMICLNEALNLHRSDPWTLVQYGDYLKRIGSYDEAVKVLRQAEELGERDVVIGCIADVYSQQGEYEKAISTYQSISNWDTRPNVRTAIADNLRKMGRLEDAQNAYDKLLDSARQGLLDFALCEDRVRAGIAEIAKKQGRIDDAFQSYSGILNKEGLDEQDRLFYKLGFCNIMKLKEKYEDAYAIVDEIIQDYPFLMQARFARGSILGLIGRELKGLEDLPESSGSRCWQEWQRRYYRGLLLFKLKRYEEAKKNLVEELPKALASEEEKAILRMGAALWFLREDETLEADKILSEIPNLYDCHVQYLSLVLKLHSAMQKKDLTTINSLRARIAGIKIVDVKLEKAVAALGERNFSLALDCETDALLKIAA
jgi:tetratricopeptide (TPR) repeat protein